MFLIYKVGHHFVKSHLTHCHLVYWALIIHLAYNLDHVYCIITHTKQSGLCLNLHLTHTPNNFRQNDGWQNDFNQNDIVMIVNALRHLIYNIEVKPFQLGKYKVLFQMFLLFKAWRHFINSLLVYCHLVYWPLIIYLAYNLVHVYTITHTTHSCPGINLHHAHARNDCRQNDGWSCDFNQNEMLMMSTHQDTWFTTLRLNLFN